MHLFASKDWWGEPPVMTEKPDYFRQLLKDLSAWRIREARWNFDNMDEWVRGRLHETANSPMSPPIASIKKWAPVYSKEEVLKARAAKCEDHFARHFPPLR